MLQRVDAKAQLWYNILINKVFRINNQIQRLHITKVCTFLRPIAYCGLWLAIIRARGGVQNNLMPTQCQRLFFFLGDARESPVSSFPGRISEKNH
ncbi:hypothetical protein M5689_000077 [Euphorbia peplus]|nr:hypothetical protein M5689_000077 [Euphorbia peplus]